jgi:GNAT superfamily N-acetyltransferase
MEPGLRPPPPGLQIVRAETADADRLTAIAMAAKRSWGYPEAWMEQWRPLLTITADFIAAHPTFLANLGAGPVGFYAMEGDSFEWELVHLWVEPAKMGQGIGRALFAHAIATARSAGAEHLRIESDPHAEGFYVRMGAQRIGEHVYELAGTKRGLPVLGLQL